MLHSGRRLEVQARPVTPLGATCTTNTNETIFRLTFSLAALWTLLACCHRLRAHLCSGKVPAASALHRRRGPSELYYPIRRKDAIAIQDLPDYLILPKFEATSST